MKTRRGQALVLFALLLPLALLPAAASGTEVSLIAARQARLSEVAVIIALDAAQELDAASLRADGTLSIDPSAAPALASAELAALEPAATLASVSVSGRTLQLSLYERVPLHLAVLIRGAAVQVRASATASLTPGLDAPS